MLIRINLFTLSHLIPFLIIFSHSLFLNIIILLNNRVRIQGITLLQILLIRSPPDMLNGSRSAPINRISLALPPSIPILKRGRVGNSSVRVSFELRRLSKFRFSFPLGLCLSFLRWSYLSEQRLVVEPLVDLHLVADGYVGLQGSGVITNVVRDGWNWDFVELVVFVDVVLAPQFLFALTAYNFQFCVAYVVLPFDATAGTPSIKLQFCLQLLQLNNLRKISNTFSLISLYELATLKLITNAKM